jgi:hypothetical protein
MSARTLRVAALVVLAAAFVGALLVPALQCHVGDLGQVDQPGPCPSPVLKYAVALFGIVVALVLFRRSFGRSR